MYSTQSKRNSADDASHRIDAATAFQLLCHKRAAAVDVRSEKEFLQGHFEGTSNYPILNDGQRHEVGLTYKQQGNAAATALGHQLVGPAREDLVNQWRQALSTTPDQALLFCWRGGQRSKIAGHWLQQAGHQASRVEGGYKALRRHALSILHQAPAVVVLTGYTGSDKTVLLKHASRFLDIEGLAHHRGSAFGAPLDGEQPAQATFENNLALHLVTSSIPGQPLLVEDESRNIGRCFLPLSLYQAIQNGPVVWLDVPLEQRVDNIVREYVTTPLATGVPGPTLKQHYLTALSCLQRRLGGELYQSVLDQMQAAFDGASGSSNNASHRSWVASLLQNYYDRSYDHSQNRMERQVLFRGGPNAVLDFLKQQVS